MALSPFEPRPACPACGNDGIDYQACTAQKRVPDCTVTDSSHLHLSCTRCSTTWLMAEKQPMP